MNDQRHDNPELLAPAGDLTAGLTAFDHGADAVYAGLPKFNARERKENLSLDDMAALVARGRSLAKKVYVTVNTLIKESELEEMANYLADLNDLSPDALIVQDLGVIHMAKTYFPNLKLHGSTQMGIHNSAGVKLAASLGLERVILERQVTLDETERIIKNAPIEVEVFIHGALCCGMSGRCLLSSWMGGWSGNRGKCKQPCRRRYFSDSGNGFFLSTNDLYSLELIPRLRQIGVASLKIEGRLRRPDYVKSVVEAYRMVLDAPAETERETFKRARRCLSHSYGRKWSFGFAKKEDFDKIVQHDALGVSGLLCGKVVHVANNGFKVSLTKPIKINDRLRVQPKTGDDGPLVTVTCLTVDGKRGNSARKGENCFVHCDREIPIEALVYKIGEEIPVIVAKTPPRFTRSRQPVDLRVQLVPGTLRVVALNVSPPLQWETPVETSPAKNQPLTPNRLIDLFNASRSELLASGTIDATIDGHLFVPASALKSARRSFWTWLEGAIDPNGLESSGQAGKRRFLADYRRRKPKSNRSATPRVAHLLGAKDNPPKGNVLIARPLADCHLGADQLVIPPFCPETQLGKLTETLGKAHAAGHRFFRVTSLHGIEMLKRFDDVTMIASFPLPICNSMAAAEAATVLGVSEVQAWIELEKSEIERLVAQSPLPVELYRHGRPPLLVTRAKIPVKGEIREFRGKRFRVETEARPETTNVYPTEAFHLPSIPGTGEFFDLRRANLKEKPTSTFNFELEFK